ncbi:MAG: T9SS type A sorting domain-containing protein [Candidatus Zixiibacteriota bacterium]|nr:MAG: T9SS type A sorting domain-containing protein [candidate division Zixibacteria bacterium]
MRDIMKGMVLLLALVLCSSTTFGQASSTNFTLVTGTFVSTGGVAVSTTGTTLTASIPTTISGTSSSPTYTVASGVIGVAYTTSALTAAYAGGAVQTVTPSDQVLKVGYAGELGTAIGVFYYRQGGDVSYSFAPMLPGVGDTLQYTCQASLLGIRGLEYYFQVFRGTSMYTVGSPTAPYAFQVSLSNAECQSSPMPTRSYRMVGLPINPSAGNEVGDVFEDDLGAYNREIWRLGRFNAAAGGYREFPNIPTVAPGRAYWLITRDAETFGSAGTTVRPNRTYAGNAYLAIPLDEGWNQVANPFPFAVAWSEMAFDDNGTVVTDPTGVVENALYSYDGSAYNTVTQISPWSGVFLRTEKAGVALLVRYHRAGAAKPAAVEQAAMVGASDIWQLELQMEAGGKKDIGNFAGVHSDASEGADYCDLSEPPAAPEGVMLAFKLPDGSERLRRVDYRPEFNDGASWDVVFSEDLNRLVRVRGVNSIPDDMQAWLILEPGEMIRLAEGQEIKLPDDVKSARLVVGKESYVNGEIDQALPKSFALNQNYPNPFNPSTTVRFALPQASPVALKVYNLLGQRVATVVDREMEAGHHTVTWEGCDDNGNRVASGIYFYRLEAGSFKQTKKMLMLK